MSTLRIDDMETRIPQDQQYKEPNNPPQKVSEKSSVQSKNLFKRMINLLKNNLFQTITLLILCWSIALQVQVSQALQTIDSNQNEEQETNSYFTNQVNDFTDKVINLQQTVDNRYQIVENRIDSMVNFKDYLFKKVFAGNNPMVQLYGPFRLDKWDCVSQTQNQSLTYFPKPQYISLEKKSFVSIRVTGSILSMNNKLLIALAVDKKLIKQNLNEPYPSETIQQPQFQSFEFNHDLVLEQGAYLFEIVCYPVDPNVNQVEFNLKDLAFTIKLQGLKY